MSQTFVLKGTAQDELTNEYLSDVNILADNYPQGTITNRQGKFSLPGLSGSEEISLTFSHVGYRIKSIIIHSNEADEYLNVMLTPSPIDIGEVSILSSRSEKTLQKNPQPLEIMNSRQIENSAGITVADYVRNESGICLTRDGIWGTSVNIRGLSRDNIVTLIDGNRIETATAISAGLSLVDVDDIERIEILKGAASALYGSGALGGVVNIVSKQSNYSENFYLGGGLQTSYNSVNKGSYSSFNLLAGEKDWHFKLTTSYRNSLDIRTPQGTMPNSRFHDNNISSLLVIRPFQGQELKINYQRSRATDVGIPGGDSFPDAADVRYPEEKRDLISLDYTFTQLSKDLLRLNIKYFYQNIFRDVENIPHIVKHIPANDTTPAKRVSVLSIKPSANHITHGFQSQSDWSFSNHYLIAGIDMWRRAYRGEREKTQKIEVLNSQSEVVATTNLIIGEQALPDADYTSIGFYLQDDIKYGDDLSVTVGGRLDKIYVSNSTSYNPVYQITNGIRNDSPPNQSVIFNESESDNFSWSTNLSLLYKINNVYDITITAARSFRSPTLEERYQYIDLGSYVRLGDPDLEPENGYFFDLGLRRWGENLLFKGNLFVNYLNNLVVEKPGQFENRDAFIKTNVGEAVLYGFDFSLQYMLTESMKFYSTASYVLGRDIEKNEDLPQIPPFNGTLGVTLPIFEFINIDLFSSVFSKQQKVATNEKTTPGYALFNCYVNFDEVNLGNINLKISTGVENIFDKLYRNHLASNRNLITAEPGRNIYVKVKLNW